MDIFCVGCCHGYFPKLEGGDLLIVTGDLTAKHTEKEHFKFNNWLEKQDYKKIILIAGNHDTWIEKNECAGFSDYDGQKIEYLCDSGTKFEGLKIWGSPHSPLFNGVNPKCTAFMENDKDLFKYWELIPQDTDILITHCPPYGILDGILQEGTLFHAGSQSLFNYLKYVIRPRYHIFSHIHEGYGQDEYFPTYNDEMMQSINCSHVNEKYKPVNKPIRLIL